MDTNIVTIKGRITKDADFRVTDKGTPVANFSIANNKVTKNAQGETTKVASFFDCVTWGNTANHLLPYLKKGTQLIVVGRLEQSKWTDADGTIKSRIFINVQSIDLLATPKTEEAPTEENPWVEDDGKA